MQKGFKRALAVVMTAVLTVGSVSYSGPAERAKAAQSSTSLTKAEADELYTKYYADKTYDRVSVHDPSIVVGYYEGSTYTSSTKVYGTQNATKDRKEIYFVFGSHMAWAYSTDLENWKTFTNNINTDYASIFAEDETWSKRGSTQYDLSGNLWAPDIIWNEQMQKWCMYMSVNGDNWYTSIVMLTADSLNGSWTRVSPVVYSGFMNDTEAALTDYFDVTGDTTLNSRYTERNNGNAHYSMNAIDPCVLYDDDGKMWMSYGSWFGGIYMIELDPATGLRKTATTYDYVANESDPYLGIKIAGGNNRSGEASYIQKIGDKYYLFMSYGGLTSTGGYNMRVFSSDTITGPYKDMDGEDARYGDNTGVVTNSDAGNINGHSGSRLMSYYKWSFMDKGFTAEGHNSAFVDDDGKSYVIYHTRTNDGTETHELRVHQLFQAKNGGLVTAPFEYSGETLADTAYDSQDVAGNYNILKMVGTDYKNLECVQEQTMSLNEDGTVTGALTGSWQQESDGPYVTITAGNVTYQGVFVKQNVEQTGQETMCITLIGNEDTAVWGYRQQSNGQPFCDEAVVAYNVKNNKANIPSQVYAGKNLSLPTEGYYGASYTWKSSDSSVISDEGKIGAITADAQVTMEAAITSGDYTYTASYPVKVIASASPEDLIPIDKEAVVAEYDDMTSFNEAAPSKKISDNTGLSVSFYAEGVVSDWDTIAKTTDGKYTMHLAVLSGEKCDFYEKESVVSDYAKSLGYTSDSVWQAFQSKKCYVTVSYNTDGSIAYYMNGNLMLTYEADTTPSWNETGYASTPKAIAANVISAYKNGLLQFAPAFRDTTQGSISISGIMVGFAADFDPDNYVEADYGQYLYYEDYDNLGSTNAWTAQNTQAEISKESDETHGNYASLKIASSASGNRYAYNKFTDISSDLSKYTVEMDVALTGGDRDGRSQSAFAILDQSSAMTGYAGNYLVKMTTDTYSAAAPSTRYTWYINDDTTGIEIPTGEWVHLKAYVDVSAGTVTLDITKDGISLYSKSAAYSGTGLVGGIFAQLGRQNGATAIDNIKVYNGTEEPTATLVTKSKLSYGKTITPSVTSASNVQWYRCDTYKGTETAISGATSLSYEPAKADFGKYLIMKSSNVTLYYEEPVAAKEISVSMKAENKEYDGTNSANVSYTLDGVVSGDDLEVKAESVTFEDANIGNNKKVTAAGISLAGADAKYYTLTTTTATATANITAKADNNNGGNNNGGNNNGNNSGNNNSDANTNTNTNTNTNAGTNTSTPPGTASDSTPAVGTTAVVSKATYKLTSSSEVTLVKGNTKATSVTVGTTVKIQGKKYKVTAIAANAFKNSKKLKKVTIGANIKSIGKNAFYGCKKLKTISIKTTKLSTSKVGKNAFKGIQAKAKITVPKKKFKAYKTMLKKRGVGKNAKITKK